MIFDIIVIAVFVIMIVRCTRRGAVRSLANVITCIVSYLGATILGQLIANFCYTTFVEPAVTRAVSDAVTNVSGDLASSIAASLPPGLSLLFNASDAEIAGAFTEPVVDSKDVIIGAVNEAVYPVANALLTFFITVILMILFLMVTKRFLVIPLTKIMKLPLLRTADRLLGVVVGVIEALLLVCVIAFLAKLVLVYIGSNSEWFSEEKINNSFIFKLFYSGNIFIWISSLIEGSVFAL